MDTRLSSSIALSSLPSEAMQLTLVHHHLDEIKRYLDQEYKVAALRSADDALLAAKAIQPPQHALMLKLSQRVAELGYFIQSLLLTELAIRVADPDHPQYTKDITKLYLNLVIMQIRLDKKDDAISSVDHALASTATLQLSDPDLIYIFDLAVNYLEQAKMHDTAERVFIRSVELSPNKAQLLEKAPPEIIERLTKTSVSDRHSKHDAKMVLDPRPSEAMQLSLAHHHLDQIKQYLDKADKTAALKSADNTLLVAGTIQSPQNDLMIKLSQRAVDLGGRNIQALSLMERAIQVADPHHHNYTRNMTKLYLNLVVMQIYLDKKDDAICSANKVLANAATLQLSDPYMVDVFRLAVDTCEEAKMPILVERLFLREFELSPNKAQLLEKAPASFNRKMNTDAKVLNQLAESLAKSTDATDRKASIQYYVRAAKLEDTTAMYALGMAYQEGHGVERNLTEAAAWFINALAVDPDSKQSTQQLEKLMSQSPRPVVAAIKQEKGILALEQCDVALGFYYLSKYTPDCFSAEHNYLVGLFIYSNFVDRFSMLDYLYHGVLSRKFRSDDARHDRLFNRACQHLAYAEQKSPEAKNLLENIKHSHAEVNQVLGFKTEQSYRVYHVFNALNFHFFRNESFESNREDKEKERQASNNIIKTIMGYCGK